MLARICALLKLRIDIPPRDDIQGVFPVPVFAAVVVCLKVEGVAVLLCSIDVNNERMHRLVLFEVGECNEHFLHLGRADADLLRKEDGFG